MDEDKKKQRLATFLKWSAGLVGAAAMAPVAVLALKGALAGLAFVVVGGTGLVLIKLTPWIAFKTSNVVIKVANVYEKGVINYSNLRSGSVRTLSARAIALTRQYTRPQMIAPQQKFRACFYAHLDDLKETPGTHPKWQAVDPNDHGSWDWYEIPGETGPPAAAAGVPPTGIKGPAPRKGRKP